MFAPCLALDLQNIKAHTEDKKQRFLTHNSLEFTNYYILATLNQYYCYGIAVK